MIPAGRAATLPALHLLAWLLAACSSTAPDRNSPPAASSPRAPAVPPAPASPAVPERSTPPPAPRDLQSIPDAVPRVEPRSARGNPVYYEVFGKRYYLLPTSEGYRERGVASWYGPDFHSRPTSSGEPYDMYAMTAAHKTLPIPAYARVTNLSNGRSIVVRINDRGPFVANRIIDLSYTAAHKLEMTRAGTAFVEVEVITPGTPQDAARTLSSAPAAPALAGPVLYLQAGAFGVAANAHSLAGRLRNAGIAGVTVSGPDGTPPLYRVRVGPFTDVASYDQLAARVTALGVEGRLVSE